MFLIPSIASGEYSLEVRAAFGENDIRTGVLDATLTLA